MTVKISLIGLGQIGASIGLALANHKDQVTTLGYDLSHGLAQRALELGAVEKIERSLPLAVKEADVVLLALPIDQVYEALQLMAGDLRDEVVVMDTAPVKMAVAAWVKELLPPRRHYVGLTPALNPAVLDDNETGLSAARADLFQKGLVAVSVPSGTAEEAVQLAASFVTLLGAHPFFVDLAEVDGIMALAGLLPELVAAALAESAIGQPGWADIRKLAGRSFAAGTRVLDLEEPATLAETAIQNRANAVRVLDDTIAVLGSLRDEIAAGDRKKLEARLTHIQEERSRWYEQRAKGDWLSDELAGMEIPSARDVLGQQLGGLGKFFDRRKKKPRPD
jgi:prephenate dehydrogenase